MAEHDRGALASRSVARHLTRGAIGFGLIGSALALTPSVGPAALLLAPPGMVALRGCPTCWIAGLIQTISSGRLERTCTDTGCTLQPSPAPTAKCARGSSLGAGLAQMSGGILETVIAPEQLAVDRERGDAEHPELMGCAGGLA